MVTPPEKPAEYSSLSLVFVMGFLIGTASLIVAVSAPFDSLLGRGSSSSMLSAMHGVMSLLFLFVSTISLYLGWRLLTRRLGEVSDLQLITAVMATLSFLTILLGNWIYAPYRSSAPGGARSWLLANNPDVHRVFFEFKEYAALFTLPLSVAAAFILWRYQRQVLAHPWLRVTVALLLAMDFFYLLAAFGLGAAVCRVRGL